MRIPEVRDPLTQLGPQHVVVGYSSYVVASTVSLMAIIICVVSDSYPLHFWLKPSQAFCAIVLKPIWAKIQQLALLTSEQLADLPG